MRFYTTLITTILLFFLLIFASCSYRQQQILFEQPNSTLDTSRITATSGSGTSDYHIKSQDILQIRNLQNTKYIVDETPSAATSVGGGASGGNVTSEGQTYQVEEDGTVALPIIGHVQVAGLTRAQAAKLVEGLYRKNVLVDPIID